MMIPPNWAGSFSVSLCLWCRGQVRGCSRCPIAQPMIRWEYDSMAFPKPPKASIVYEDANAYAALAMYHLARGHTVVVWKRNVRDLHLLSCAQLEHLMDVVDLVRDALLQALGVEKVYLMYMDEARHVHWHLVPRYNERGFNVFRHTPKRVRTFPLAEKLRAAVEAARANHAEFRRGSPRRTRPQER